jgi:hypothetical protein
VQRVARNLRLVRPDDVLDDGSAEWTMASTAPLLHSAIKARTHVATGVQDRVDRLLVADRTIETIGGRVQGGIAAGWGNGHGRSVCVWIYLL